MDDRMTIRRVQAGDVDAYATLVERYHRNLLKFIFHIVKDPDLAEDIGQEVFLQVYQELRRFDPDRGAPFSAWLYVAARNRCISELRRLRRTESVPTELLDELPGGAASAEESLLRREEREALSAILQDLPEPFRSTILMSLKGGSIEEIARDTGVTAATVKTRLFRAKEKIRLLWKGHFGGVGHESI